MLSDPMHFVIRGRPVVQKNSRRVLQAERGGRRVPIVAMSKDAEKWRKKAISQLVLQRRGRFIPAGIELNAAIVSYLGKGQRADADNLLAAPLDALAHAGIIESDYWVRSFDGSDRRRDNSNPRVEVTLTVREEQGS